MSSSDLRTAAQQALEAMEEGTEVMEVHLDDYFEAMNALRAALAEPVQEPVAGRAFFERILAAMEGVIDVADRKTDEFDALRSCVIDLTLMLHTAPPQLPAEPVREPVAWSGYDLDGMVEAFSRVIEAHYQRANPFQNPIYMDAQMALRILRGFIPAMKAYTAPPQQAEPLPQHDQHCVDVPGYGLMAVRLVRAIERAHGIGDPDRCPRCGKRLGDGLHTCTPLGIKEA